MASPFPRPKPSMAAQRAAGVTIDGCGSGRDGFERPAGVLFSYPCSLLTHTIPGRAPFSRRRAGAGRPRTGRRPTRPIAVCARSPPEKLLPNPLARGADARRSTGAVAAMGIRRGVRRPCRVQRRNDHVETCTALELAPRRLGRPPAIHPVAPAARRPGSVRDPPCVVTTGWGPGETGRGGYSPDPGERHAGMAHCRVSGVRSTLSGGVRRTSNASITRYRSISNMPPRGRGDGSLRRPSRRTGRRAYCCAIAMRMASSGETKWSEFSAASAIAICTPFTTPVNAFPRGP